MHQQQWLAMVEELGGYKGVLPIPNSFPREKELTEFSHTFFSTAVDVIAPPEGRWTNGPSLNSKGEYRTVRLRPMEEEPQLAPPIPQAFAQIEEMEGGKVRMAAMGRSGETSSEGIVSRLTAGVRHVIEDLTSGKPGTQ